MLTDNPLRDNFSEQSLLAAMLWNTSIIPEVVATLDPVDFYVHRNRLVYEQLAKVWENRKVFDVNLFMDYLSDSGFLKKVEGGFMYLTDLVDAVDNTATSKCWPEYVKRIQEKAKRRKLDGIGCSISDASKTGTPSEEIISTGERRLREMQSTEDGRSSGVSMADFSIPALDKMETRSYEKNKLPTGFPDLDRIIGGMTPGNIIVIAGRPAMGKTTLAMNIALSVAKLRKTVVFVSLEMSVDELMERWYFSEARIIPRNFQKEKMTSEEASRFVEVQRMFSELSIQIYPMARLTPLILQNEMIKFKQEKGIDLIIIDYLQLMVVPGSENRNQEITTISREICNLARELNVPILLLSQLSRSLQSRVDKRPQLSDLRDSGAIEQDAHIVIMIYRPVEYKTVEQINKEPELKTKAELLIRKNRMGPTGVVELLFFAEYVKFESKDW